MITLKLICLGAQAPGTLRYVAWSLRRCNLATACIGRDEVELSILSRPDDTELWFKDGRGRLALACAEEVATVDSLSFLKLTLRLMLS